MDSEYSTGDANRDIDPPLMGNGLEISPISEQVSKRRRAAEAISVWVGTSGLVELTAQVTHYGLFGRYGTPGIVIGAAGDFGIGGLVAMYHYRNREKVHDLVKFTGRLFSHPVRTRNEIIEKRGSTNAISGDQTLDDRYLP